MMAPEGGVLLHAFGDPQPPVPRLVAALEARGHSMRPAAAGRPGERATLVLGAGVELDPMALGVLLGAWRTAPGARVLVLSQIGAGSHARSPRLRALWNMEERARGSGMAVLALRLPALLGRESPLWLRLRSQPRLPRGGRQVLHPLVEDDAVEALDRVLRGRLVWEGSHDLSGAEPFTLAQLAELAAGAPRLDRNAGAWEPPLEDLGDEALASGAEWAADLGMELRSVRDAAKGWVA